MIITVILMIISIIVMSIGYYFITIKKERDTGMLMISIPSIIFMLLFAYMMRIYKIY